MATGEDASVEIGEEVLTATEKPNLGMIMIDKLVKKVLDRCTTRVVEDLAPQYLLDRFTEKGCMLFTQIRDISEQKLTSEKNREIHHAVRRSASKYVTFKEALVETRQTNLAQLLTITEVLVHDEMKGLGYECQCSSSKECKLLHELAGSPKEHIQLTPTVAVKELQQMLIHIYKECYLHLSVNPLSAEITEPLSNLYVEPTLRVLEFAPVASSPFDTNSCQIKNRRVQSVADLLTPTSKKVFIVGEAGMGKTAYCRHIVRAWCQSLAGRSSKAWDKGSDEMVMSNFDLLFYIPLKDYEFCGDIETMIGELVRTDISEMLHEQRCLVILDGLDEWSPPTDYKRALFVTKGLPNRNITNRYTVLTTTRPWKLASIKPKRSDIDVLSEITGLDSNATQTLTSNLLTVLGNKTPTETDAFFRSIHQAGLESHVHIPAVLSQLVCLWYRQRSFGENLLDTYVSMVERCFAIACKDGTQTQSKPREMSGHCPPCFRKQRFEKVWDILLVLSQLAYQSLLSVQKVTNEQLLTVDVKKIGMEAGLLSESVVYNAGIERESNVSFVHRSFQEVLAALHMATGEQDSIEKVFEVCNSTERIMEIANTLIFICGMEPELCEYLSKKVMTVVDHEEQIIEYRSSSTTDKINIIQKIQNLILKCVDETFSSNSRSTAIRAHLHDVSIDQRTAKSMNQVWRKTNENTMKSIIRMEEVKSAYIKTDSLVPENLDNELFLEMFHAMEDSQQLEKLHLDDSRHILPLMDVYGLICQSYSSLKTLCMEWINLDGLGKRFSVVLEKLSLVSLCIRHARLAHSQLNDIQLGLSGLQELELIEVRCADCSFNSCRYPLVIDNKVRLRKLKLSGLDVEDVQFTANELVHLDAGPLHCENAFRSILSNVQDENNVSELICSDCTDIVALTSLLSRASKLKSMKLSRTDFGKSKIALISSDIEFIRLEYVTISRKAALDFVDGLQSLTQVVHVELYAVTSEYDLLVITHHLRRNSSKFTIIKDTINEIWFETRKPINY